MSRPAPSVGQPGLVLAGEELRPDGGSGFHPVQDQVATRRRRLIHPLAGRRREDPGLAPDAHSAAGRKSAELGEKIAEDKKTRTAAPADAAFARGTQDGGSGRGRGGQSAR